MSLPVPLSVRLVRTQSGPDAHDRHITAQLRDLTYRAAVPGGFTSARLSLHRSLALPPEELAHYARVIVYDNAAQVMWEGRLEDPARSAGVNGEVYDLTAIGPAGHARDRTVPLVYVDRLFPPWVRSDNVTPNATLNVAADPGLTDDTQALVFQFPQGLGVVTNSRVVAQYNQLRDAQKLARYDYTWDAGSTNASALVQAVTSTSGGTSETSRSESLSTSGGGSSPKVVVTNFPNGRNVVAVRSIWTGGAATAGNDYWLSVRNLVVIALQYNANGTERTTGYTSNTVLASDVVKDLLGRLLSKYDGAGATITTTTHPIDQLAYPDGVTAEKVLGDLATLEPGHYWVAWESNTAGKHRFEYIPWPTSVTYETSVDDVASFPSSATELFDKVRVRWRDVDGKIRTVQRTQTVQALTDAGITREDFLDLGDEIGSQANAERAGDQHLAEHATAANRGTLTVARPIYSTALGRMVPPWELPRRLPGSLIRVRGVTPNVNALNATTHNAVTVFRVVSAEFNASSMSTQLELDTFQPTIARTVARIAKQPVTRRR